MSSTSKLFILFLTGLIFGFLFFVSKPHPIGSRLPDLIFPKVASPLTIIFTGDVMLGRSVNTRIQKYGDPTWPFIKISSILAQSDITIINLESPFLKGCRPTDYGMVFCADPKSVDGLVHAGIDFASLANNHINNQGQIGIDDTVSILKENSITPITQNEPVFTTVKNTSLALLAYSDLPQINENNVTKQVSEASNSADLVIVTFHWGEEYQDKPNARQILLAHLAIDSGADIVVGHHPHWIQTEEIYLGKPIYYSLGNLVFDQMWSEKTRLGEILKVTYQNNLLTKKEVIPIKIFDYGQPDLYLNTSDLK